MADIKGVLAKVSPKHAADKSGKPKSLASYRLGYESPQNQLEPTYYWVLDFIGGLGFKVEKIVDNFMSSPGSGHFSEMGQRATLMQQQGTKLSADLHQLIKSTINILYDLREFEQRLSHYKDAESDKKEQKAAGVLALKQIWLDSVDLPKRGRGSIHQMSADLGYVTLRDAFMIADTIKDVERMAEKDGTINDAVKRILIPRIDEFTKWRDFSYQELQKRESIERNYLRSQIETIKLYSSWMKPYFKAAEQLRQQGFDKSAALVNAFSTSMFELTLLGTSKTKAPKQVEKYNIRRDYNSVVLITLKYRGHLAQKADQKGNYGFAFGGKVEIEFDAYSLNQEELDLMKKEMGKEDFEDALYSFDIADEALKDLKGDFDYFLKSKEERDKEDASKKKQKKKQDDINPFTALFGSFKKTPSKKEDKKEINEAKDIRSDNWVEKHLRAEAANSAASRLYAAYDVYKKSHGMPSSPDSFENYGKKEVSPEVSSLGEALKSPGEKKKSKYE
jgi:hypothetical protein